ncbi:MAG TPA: NAD(P)/FAD-dependent oxidoreductase, partial [Agitococcus sp.]|nr:NAD(P)/FAD-dependent oxidoreductase [Agitococcus sp.]
MSDLSIPHIAIIGGGAAGLMAADILRAYPVQVSIYEAKPSVGRKFLLAGKGGMNITHSEDFDAFCQRYGAEKSFLQPMLEQFNNQ